MAFLPREEVSQPRLHRCTLCLFCYSVEAIQEEEYARGEQHYWRWSLLWSAARMLHL